jgi:undecaprenyl diphosphate synthase
MKRDLSVPRHVAIVMDGNGRWAKKRYLPRFFGHKAGRGCAGEGDQRFADRGVEYLTVFAFSSENWKRPEDEVSGLMGLVLVAVTKYLGKLARDGVRSSSSVTATRSRNACAPPGPRPRKPPGTTAASR